MLPDLRLVMASPIDANRPRYLSDPTFPSLPASRPSRCGPHLPRILWRFFLPCPPPTPVQTTRRNTGPSKNSVIWEKSSKPAIIKTALKQIGNHSRVCMYACDSYRYVAITFDFSTASSSSTASLFPLPAASISGVAPVAGSGKFRSHLQRNQTTSQDTGIAQAKQCAAVYSEDDFKAEPGALVLLGEISRLHILGVISRLCTRCA